MSFELQWHILCNFGAIFLRPLEINERKKEKLHHDVAFTFTKELHEGSQLGMFSILGVGELSPYTSSFVVG